MFSTIDVHRDELGHERPGAPSRSLPASLQIAKIVFMVFVIAVALAVPVVASPFV